MIRFLFDENTHGAMRAAVGTASQRTGGSGVDTVRVGDSGGPAYGTPDPMVLRWAAAARRVLVTHDYQTMPGYLSDLLAEGRSSPGILLLKPKRLLSEVAESLAIIAHAGMPEDYADRISWIPLGMTSNS